MVLILLSSVSPALPTPTSLPSFASPNSNFSSPGFFAILSPIFTPAEDAAAASSPAPSPAPSPRVLSPGNIPPVTPPPWLLKPQSPTSPLRPPMLRLASEGRLDKRLPPPPRMMSYDGSSRGQTSSFSQTPLRTAVGSGGIVQITTPPDALSTPRIKSHLHPRPPLMPRTRTDPFVVPSISDSNSPSTKPFRPKLQTMPSAESSNISAPSPTSQRLANSFRPRMQLKRAETSPVSPTLVRPVPRLTINGMAPQSPSPHSGRQDVANMSPRDQHRSPTYPIASPHSSSQLRSISSPYDSRYALRDAASDDTTSDNYFEDEDDEARHLSQAMMGVDVDIGTMFASKPLPSPGTIAALQAPVYELDAASYFGPSSMDVPLAIASPMPSPGASSSSGSPAMLSPGSYFSSSASSSSYTLTGTRPASPHPTASQPIAYMPAQSSGSMSNYSMSAQQPSSRPSGSVPNSTVTVMPSHPATPAPRMSRSRSASSESAASQTSISASSSASASTLASSPRVPWSARGGPLGRLARVVGK